MILPHNRFAFIMGQLRDRWSEQIKQMEFSVVRWEINRFIAMGNFNFWFLCMHTTPYCSVDVFISMKSNFDTFKLFWPPVTVFFSIQMLTRLDNAFFFLPFFDVSAQIIRRLIGCITRWLVWWFTNSNELTAF